MEIVFTECIAVTDTSSVGEVRRSALSAAHRLGIDETRSGELALLATEASRNVLLHGGGGQVVLEGLSDNHGQAARILALDCGGGIANIPQAMIDGFSTGGTLGGGMGAMERIADKFEIFSGKAGTILMLDLGLLPQFERVQVAGFSIPCPGEQVCGDEWTCQSFAGRTLAVVVDGLGHGWGAAEAAREGIAAVRQNSKLAPGAILECMHDALRKTRGGVAGIAEIRPEQKSMIFAGVGNISCSMISEGKSRSFVSHNGTLGLHLSRIQEFQSNWPEDAVLILHSDGLQSKWDLSSYPGLASRHPALICGALLRDFRRQRDDTTVVVVKAAS